MPKEVSEWIQKSKKTFQDHKIGFAKAILHVRPNG